MNGNPQGDKKDTWAHTAAVERIGPVWEQVTATLPEGDELAREKVMSLLNHFETQLAHLVLDTDSGNTTPRDFEARLAELEEGTLNQAQELALSDQQRKIAAMAGMTPAEYAKAYRRAVRHE